jgi:16S rRNA (cytosine1402-N4)-methyltransferase
MRFAHTPVLLAECLAALDIKPGGRYVDGTAGGGGHARAIAERLAEGRLYAFDKDPDAVLTAGAALAGLPAEVIKADFRNAAAELQARGVDAIDGALLDLGVSSHQLDSPQRGFSYHEDAPLDMRMSQSGPTAADLVNTLERQPLADLLREYGEEPYAWQIAGRIVEARQIAPIKTTGRLAELVMAAVPAARRRGGKNPARQTFQALRIATNGELDALSEALNALFGLLVPGGRLAVISFHSLEDRIVKRRFRGWATACTCPPEWPVCVCGGAAKARMVGKNPRTASPGELEENRRSRSAKLRVCEKL